MFAYHIVSMPAMMTRREILLTNRSPEPSADKMLLKPRLRWISKMR